MTQGTVLHIWPGKQAEGQGGWIQGILSGLQVQLILGLGNTGISIPPAVACKIGRISRTNKMWGTGRHIIAVVDTAGMIGLCEHFDTLCLIVWAF